MDDTSIPDLSPEEVRKAKKREQARLRVQRYRERHPERAQASSKKYKDAHKRKTALQWQSYYGRNHERLLQASHLRREQQPETVRAADRKWKKAHPEKCLAQWARKRARKRNAPINDFTAEQWSSLCKAVGYRCAYCQHKFAFKQLTQDHITPLARGGSHTLSNIIPACLPCNSRKQDRAVLKPVQPFLLLSDEEAAD
jgi:5-methylcytosine-specific restriction endonuclease McrA